MAVRDEIRKVGAGVIQRFEVAHTRDATNAEFVGATFPLLATGAVARPAHLRRERRPRLTRGRGEICGVGGALDAAQRCFEQRDAEGARRFIEAAMDVLGYRDERP